MTTEIFDSNRAILQELQIKIEGKRKPITRLFQNAMKSLNANAGFIGFENVESKIAIFTAAGDTKFVYADKSEGFVSDLLKGDSDVFDTKRHSQIKTKGGAEKTTFSEIGGPIKYEGFVVGVVLFDRHQIPRFKKSQCNVIDELCTEIQDLLSGEQPWPFRTWWEEHEPSARNAYSKNLEKDVKPVLNNQNQAFISMFGKDGFVQKREITIAGKKTVSEDEVEKCAVLTGRAQSKPDVELKGKICLPFPSTGPVLGVLTVYVETGQAGETQKLKTLEQQLVSKIEKIPFSYFDTLFKPDDVSGLFVSLMMNSLSRSMGFFKKVDTVRKDIRKLVQERFTILLNSQIWSDIPEKTPDECRIVDESELRARVLPKEQREVQQSKPSNRPSCWVDESELETWLNCPIWVGTRLLGGIQSIPRTKNASKYSRYGFELDGPITEIISTVFARIVSEEAKAVSKADLIDLCTQGRGKRQLLDVHSQLYMRSVNSYFLTIAVFEENGTIQFSYSCEDDELDMKDVLEECCRVYHEFSNTDNVILFDDESEVFDLQRLAELFARMHSSQLMLKKSRWNEKEVVVVAGLIREASYRTGFSQDDLQSMNLATHLIHSLFC